MIKSKPYSYEVSMVYDHTDIRKEFDKGAIVQFNDPDCGWVDIRNPLWLDRCEYRLKPSQSQLLDEANVFSVGVLSNCG